MPGFWRKLFRKKQKSKKIDLINQNLRERYWTEKELQRLLASLFPDIPIQCFETKLKEDEWTFNAPRLVSSVEFREARREFDKEMARSGAAATY